MNVSGALQRHGFAGALATWAVVGNGPLYATDRARIAAADVVLRFNDVNNKRMHDAAQQLEKTQAFQQHKE